MELLLFWTSVSKGQTCVCPQIPDINKAFLPFSYSLLQFNNKLYLKLLKDKTLNESTRSLSHTRINRLHLWCWEKKKGLIVSISNISTVVVICSFCCQLLLLVAWTTAQLWSFYYKLWFDSKPSQLGTIAVLLQCGVTRLASRVHVCRTQVDRKHGERDSYVFIKSTRKQLRRLCSLDTPHLFIIIPLAVTLLFIIACWFICSSSLKPHLTSSFTLAESAVVRMYKDAAL